MLIAGDVYPDVREVLGRCDSSFVYNLMSDAIELLANKKPTDGPAWQPLLIYLNLPVTQGYYITLPSQVETVLRVNLDQHPSFSRSQLYEFTMNGPGNADKELQWGWQEHGDVCIQRPVPFPTQLALTCTMNNDIGVECQILCQMADQTEQWVTFGAATIVTPETNGVTPSGPNLVIDVLAVSKPPTVGPLSLWTAAGTLLAVYQPNDTAPRFQRIKLSQRGVAVRILAKRKSARVYGPTDIIPLNSKLAIVLMAKAIQLYKTDHYQEAATCEVQAMHFLDEDQTSRLSYIAVAGQLDQASIICANLKNRDCLIVADIYDDSSDIFGPIGRDNLYDQITQSIELLANKSHWDPLVGYCELCVINQEGIFYVTLPRFIEQVLAVNVNEQPGDFRSKWFEFHLNGLGSSNVNRPCNGWEEVGEVCTTWAWKDPVHMVAIPDSSRDNQASVRLFGLTPEYTPLTSPDGSAGLLVPCVTGSLSIPPEQPLIMTIDRIVKDETIGFISLVATDGTQVTQNIGYYWPDDTEPYYRRIRLGTRAARVRLKYRKRWLKVSSLTDPIPLRSRSAMICAMVAVSTMAKDPVATEAQAQAAVRYLQDEWRTNSNPLERMAVQINSRVYGGAFRSMT